MALPVVDVPIHKAILPSTGESIDFRPFLVKEKKVLMIAKEEDTPQAFYNAIKQITNNCTLGKVDVEKLALFDLQYLFLKIRAKSIGEISEFVIPCEKCEAKVPLSMNLDQVEVIKNPEHNRKIMLQANVGIMMKYPTITFDKITRGNGKNIEKELKILISCIDYVFDGDTIYPAKETPEKELTDLIENLTDENFAKITQFFMTMPQIKQEVKYTCPSCNHHGELTITDMADFFA